MASERMTAIAAQLLTSGRRNTRGTDNKCGYQSALRFFMGSSG